jgi:hypothetical protein
VNTTLTPNTPLGYSLASIPLAYSRGYTLQDQLWPFAPTRYNLQLTRITSVSRQRFSFPLNLLLGSRCQFPAPSNSPTRPVSHTRTRQRCGFQSLALANKYSKLPNLCPSYMPISSLRCPEPKLLCKPCKKFALQRCPTGPHPFRTLPSHQSMAQHPVRGACRVLDRRRTRPAESFR